MTEPKAPGNASSGADARRRSTLGARRKLQSVARWLPILWFGGVAVTSLTTRAAWAGEDNNRGAISADAGEARLPPLPKPSGLEPPPPTPEDVEELESRLKLLASPNAEERLAAARELRDVRARAIGAVIARLNSLASRGDRERMKAALSEAKERAARSKSSRRAEGDDADPWLSVLSHPAPKDKAYADVVELLALSRALTQIGTVEAARALIEIYVRFGEFMRVDTQNRLSDLKDGAVAALWEARRHKADKIARWAERQLDRLGKAAPGEAVRTADPEILADILRAFGRVKDPDAAKLVVSYANNERFQIREASRQAIALMGDVALWQLREAYEDIMGSRARRDWSWERTARELFFEYDKLHVEKVIKLFEGAKQKEREGKLEEMARDYDTILARLPQFERAAEMAKGYFALARQLSHASPLEAQVALVRVERLTDDAKLRTQAKSLRDTLVAEERLNEGLLDVGLLQAASDHDPENARAKALLKSPDKDLVELKSRQLRWLTSGAIGIVALLSVAWILLRRPKQRGDEARALGPCPHGSVAAREPSGPNDGTAGAGPDGAGPDGAGPDGAGPDGAGPDGAGPHRTGPRDGNSRDAVPTSQNATLPPNHDHAKPSSPDDALGKGPPQETAATATSDWAADLERAAKSSPAPPKDPFEGL